MRPLTPPDALMSSIASSPALRIADPGSAYGPVKGPVIPTLMTPPPPEVLELPHAPMISTARVARLVARRRRLIIDNPQFVSDARASVYASASSAHRPLPECFSGRECAGGRPLLRSTGAQYQIDHRDCQARFDRCLDFGVRPADSSSRGGVHMATGSEEPRLRVIWTDPITGRKGYAVIDRMVNGLAGGGTRMRAGIKIEGIGLADVIGGYGVAEAAAAGAEHKGWDMKGMRAVVQGFGSMGGSSARYLARHGAKVVGVIDANGAITNPDGLDVEKLLT